MDISEFPAPGDFGFDQINFEPLGRCSIVRCIRRSDGTNRQMLRIIIPYPFAALEVALGEFFHRHFGEVGHLDRVIDGKRIIGWGMRVFIDNSHRFRSIPADRASGVQISGKLIRVEEMKIRDTWGGADGAVAKSGKKK